jgi:hypothetical protein
MMHSELADVYYYQQRFAEAWPHYRQGKEVYQSLVDEFAHDPTYRNELAWSFRMEARCSCKRVGWTRLSERIVSVWKSRRSKPRNHLMFPIINSSSEAVMPGSGQCSSRKDDTSRPSKR